MRLPIRPASRHAVLFLVSALSLSCGGGDGSGGTGPTPNPVPSLTMLARDTITAGGTPFVLTVHGSKFVDGLTGSVDSIARTTARVNDTTATITLVAADVALAGDHQVRVANPEPGGGTSAALPLHVLPAPPVPTLDSISPDTVTAGGNARQLQVFGSGFVGSSVIRWNGAALATTHTSASLLSAVMTTGMLAAVDTVAVSVSTPAPGGGTSGVKSFRILPVPVPPAITTITPDTIVIGSNPVLITLHGAHFNGVDSINVTNQGNSRRSIALAGSDSTATALVDVSWLSSLGVFQASLHGPGGWGALAYGPEVVNPVPRITALTPDTLDAGKAADTLIVTGTGLVNGMALHNAYGLPMATQWMNLSHLRVIVPQATMMLGGSTAVQVDDAWDGGHSDTLPLYFHTPAPVVDSVTLQSGGSDSVGSTGENFTVWGHDLAYSGSMTADGAPRVTSHPSTSLVGFGIDGSLMTHPDTITLAYENPGPGGGTSTTFPFIVRAPNPPPAIDSVVPLVARSDSGPQVIMFRGHGFVPGTIVGPQPYAPDPSWLLQSTWPSSVIDDSTLQVSVPALSLYAGLAFTLQAQAPDPTARPSNPVDLPIWTTGVRSRDSVATGGLRYMVVDTIHNTVYATRGDSVITLDPTTGLPTGYLALPGRGDRLFLSPDASELYVQVNGGNTICRVDLPGWTLGRTIQMGTWSSGPYTYPFLGEMVVPSPLDPTRFALVRGRQFYYLNMETWQNEVWVFDDTVPRSRVDTIGGYVLDGRFEGDTLELVGRDYMYAITVDSAGPATSASVPHANIGAQAALVSPTRVAADGVLLDLITGATIATSPDLSGLVFPGRSTDRYFVARSVPIYSGAVQHVLQISAINPGDGTLRRTIGVPGFGPGSAISTPSGKLLIAGSATVAGGDPPPYIFDIASALTDP